MERDAKKMRGVRSFVFNAIVDVNIAALGPSMLLEFLLECLYVWIVEGDEHADMPNAVRLLRTRRERPRDRRAADQRDELAPFHACPQTQEAALYRLKRVLW